MLPISPVCTRFGTYTPRLTGGENLPLWSEVRPRIQTRATEARKFVGHFEYETDDLWVLPGLKAFDRLAPAGRAALSRLVLGSIDGWERRDRARRFGTGEPSTWRTTYFERSDGQPHRFPTPSPLALALETLPWLADGDHQAPPSDWWVLPPEWADGPARYRYAYLHPVPRAPLTSPGRGPSVRSARTSSYLTRPTLLQPRTRPGSSPPSPRRRPTRRPPPTTSGATRARGGRRCPTTPTLGPTT